MKKNQYLLNTLLAVVVFVAMLVLILVRTFDSEAWLPELDIPNMVLLSLVALVVEYYIQPRNKRCYICIPVLSALTFGLLPAAAGVIAWAECWKYALVGGVVFTVTTFLYSSMEDRLASGPKAYAAAIISALCLFLAAQIFAGMIL
jgi:uncharacterized membrane protein YjjP (DUF1212 family)